MLVSDLRSHLLAWYDAHRRDLPWRRTAEPYAIWLSEVMLQQTTVATVTPRWERFLERWPTAADLAAAPLDEVLHEWTGLGYYARARNLHRAAKAIADEHGGALPPSYDALKSLPGLGDYTAAAVASIAFGQAVPVLDANVERVCTRLLAFRGNPRKTAEKRALRAALEQWIDPARPGDFNQAMMELGATICSPKAPACDRCPVRTECPAADQGNPENYPMLPAKTPLTSVTEVAVLVRDAQGRVLLLRRPPTGSFANMWEPPRATAADGEAPESAAARILLDQTDLRAQAFTGPHHRFRHTVMRTRIDLLVYAALQSAGSLTHPQHAQAKWFTPEQWQDLPKSTTQAKLAKRVLENTGEGELDLFGG